MEGREGSRKGACGMQREGEARHFTQLAWRCNKGWQNYKKLNLYYVVAPLKRFDCCKCACRCCCGCCCCNFEYLIPVVINICVSRSCSGTTKAPCDHLSIFNIIVQLCGTHTHTHRHKCSLNVRECVCEIKKSSSINNLSLAASAAFAEVVNGSACGGCAVASA